MATKPTNAKRLNGKPRNGHNGHPKAHGHAVIKVAPAPPAECEIWCGDNLNVIPHVVERMSGRLGKPFRFDLTITSPPYEDARTYAELGFKESREKWVQWALPRYVASYEATSGLTAWVVEGRTEDYCYSATPLLLGADLARAGVNLRKPPAFLRIGIAGSGGPDYLRNDYEFCIAASHGRIPHAHPKEIGHKPLWGPGGEMSYRMTDGTRRNAWGAGEKSSSQRRRNGQRQTPGRPSHTLVPVGKPARRFHPYIEIEQPLLFGEGAIGQVGIARRGGKVAQLADAVEILTRDAKRLGRGNPKGSPAFRTGVRNQAGHRVARAGPVPDTANPGNVFNQKYTAEEVMALLDQQSDAMRFRVGGGQMGDRFCHENEAPFPEGLAAAFILAFTDPGDWVCDPFGGSGTVAKMALRLGRNCVSIDQRMSQCELMAKRIYGDNHTGRFKIHQLSAEAAA